MYPVLSRSASDTSTQTSEVLLYEAVSQSHDYSENSVSIKGGNMCLWGILNYVHVHLHALEIHKLYIP